MATPIRRRCARNGSGGTRPPRRRPLGESAARSSARLSERPADLLRFATAGSVDDGKSTLIGRLLYDSKQVLSDQLAHVEQTSKRMGHDFLDLSLLTDGLRAEREQGITIDVAYRYFATAQRRFIIADTPGHEQYTRNMVTGASTADLAIVLIDARKGVLAQSKRHAFISSLLGIPHVVVCVNKMDLVDFDEEVFDAIVEEFDAFAARLELPDVTFIPISALLGDNVVERSEAMPWYQGPPLLYHLEHVHIASDRNLIDVRFPVQWVIRPPSSSVADYRAYAGQVAGGVIRAGRRGGRAAERAAHDDRRASTPSTGPVEEAFPPMSVALRLADDIDVGRGSTIVRTQNQPTVSEQLRVPAVLDVRAAAEPAAGATWSSTRRARATVGEVDVRYRIDVETLHRDESADDAGAQRPRRACTCELSSPLVFDSYRRNRVTGSLIVIDEATNDTVAAGRDPRHRGRGRGGRRAKSERSPNVRWQGSRMTRERRWESLGHGGATLWFTGLPGAGKSTVAAAVEERLIAAGQPGVPARRRQPAPRPQRRPRLRRGRAQRERAPHRARRAGCSPSPARSRSSASSAPTPPTARSAAALHAADELRVHRGLRRRAAGAVRAARPEGPVRARARGRARRPDRASARRTRRPRSPTSCCARARDGRGRGRTRDADARRRFLPPRGPDASLAA